jgi:hypothetical protein
MFARVEQALRRRVVDAAAGIGPRTGRLHLLEAGPSPQAAGDVPLQYLLSSDPQRVAAGEATAIDEAKLLADRREGMFLVSYRTAGGWEALSKDLLTAVLAAGRDVHIVLPPEPLAMVKLLYPALLADRAAA